MKTIALSFLVLSFLVSCASTHEFKTYEMGQDFNNLKICVGPLFAVDKKYQEITGDWHSFTKVAGFYHKKDHTIYTIEEFYILLWGAWRASGRSGEPTPIRGESIWLNTRQEPLR